MYDRVETIRIVAPGTYELNIEKMAKSDERIVSVGKEGSYIVDLMSMAKDEPKKKRGKRTIVLLLLPVHFLSRRMGREFKFGKKFIGKFKTVHDRPFCTPVSQEFVREELLVFLCQWIFLKFVF